MRRALTAAIVVALAVLLGAAPTVEAKGNRAGGDTSDGVVRLGAAEPIVTTGGGSSSGPVCQWTRLKRGDIAGIGGSNPIGPPLSAEEGAEWATHDLDGVPHDVYAVLCPSGLEFRFINPNVTAADLFDEIIDTAERLIPKPEHNMSPTPEIGAPVNLGLWLAVEPQTVASITAEAGTAWITARPRIDNVVFSMGNGDTVDCKGLGVPYTPGSDDPGEGPCGYTYREKLPNDAAYTITVTTEWVIPYTSSSGPGTLPPISSVTTFDFNVDEIQTVGSS